MSENRVLRSADSPFLGVKDAKKGRQVEGVYEVDVFCPDCVAAKIGPCVSWGSGEKLPFAVLLWLPPSAKYFPKLEEALRDPAVQHGFEDPACPVRKLRREAEEQLSDAYLTELDARAAEGAPCPPATTRRLVEALRDARRLP